jgi:hypothetical protein
MYQAEGTIRETGAMYKRLKYNSKLVGKGFEVTPSWICWVPQYHIAVLLFDIRHPETSIILDPRDISGDI